MSGHPLQRLLATLLTAAALVALPAVAASAVPPPDVRGRTLVDDTSDDVLSPWDEDDAQDAIDRVERETPYRLHVVLVDSFDGLDPVGWANGVADASGLDEDDVVLAVAVRDRQYALAPESLERVSESELDDVAERVAEQLAQDRWEAAVVAAADGVVDASQGVRGGTVLLVVLLAAAVAGAVVVVRRRRRPVASDGAGGGRGVRAADEFREVDTPDLERRAGLAVLALDDALRSTQDALDRGRAALGPQDAARVEGVLREAREAAAQVFHLRQTLDDDVPDTERDVRDTATQIVRTSRRWSAQLGTELATIDRVRALEADVGTMLATQRAGAAAQRARLEPAQVTLAGLTERYSPDAVGSVAGDLDQASLLLTDVDATLARGDEQAAVGAADVAVGCARAAEEALTQVARLLDAVECAGTELAAALTRLETAGASLRADLTDVARLAPDDPQVADHAREARDALEDATTARAGTGDPLAALRRLTTAEAALDTALAPHRDAEDRLRRATEQVDTVIADLGEAVRTTQAYVATRRGAVGPDARTRLAEAERLHAWALSQRPADPLGALTDARRGATLAAEARRLALRDAGRASGYVRERGVRGGGMAVGGISTGFHGTTGWGDDADDRRPPADDDDGAVGSRLAEWFFSSEDDDARRRRHRRYGSGGGSGWSRGSGSSGGSRSSGGFRGGGRGGGF